MIKEVDADNGSQQTATIRESNLQVLSPGSHEEASVCLNPLPFSRFGTAGWYLPKNLQR
jgi:hypothetical protein